MEWVGAVIPNLVFLGLIVWAIVRAVGRRREERADVDQAASVRRLFVYGLLFVTLTLSAAGAALVLQELAGTAWDEADDDRSALALGLSLVIVAGPAYGLLLRHGRRRLEEEASERRFLGWAAYLNLSLLVSLIVTTVTAQQLFEGVTGVDDFEVASIAPVVVWGAVWALHWFWLKAAYGLPGDVHLAGGSLTGLVMAVIGVGGLVFVVGNEVYTRVVERVPDGHYEPELASWVIASSIGAVVWSWHWLGGYLRAERSALWHVYVVLIGALGGLVAVVGSAATIAYWTLVWFLGDPSETLSSMHFEYVPAAGAATFVVGAVAWQYHRYVLQRRPEAERTEPLRTYDYLMAGAGLVASVVGVTLALVALLEAATPDPVGTDTHAANRLILAATLSAIGAPLWRFFWARIRRHATADPAGELGAIVRRIYLIVLFGVGGIVVLVSLISVLFVCFEDLLDDTFGGQTVHSFRVGASLVATVAGVAWYHLGVFRSDREALAAIEPARPSTPLPPPPKHVVLVVPRDTALADELVLATGVRLESWYRTDDTTMPDVDVEELVARINASDAKELLVVVGSEYVTVTPVET
jgi:hypothetical protein